MQPQLDQSHVLKTATAFWAAPPRVAPRVKKALTCLALVLPLLATATVRANEPWEGIRFLLGDWQMATGGGVPGEAVSGGFTFRLELDGHVAVRRSHSEYAPKAGEKVGVQHSDLMVVAPATSGLRATYWDNESHVIQYAVTTEKGRATFESDPSAPGPRFKLVYERTGENEVTISFSIAPPGGQYQSYVRGRATRQKP